jgi:SAM-dependent methyltransferase
VVTEKSLRFYGRPYHLVSDTMAKGMRRRVLERVAEGSTIIELGCGTGELALALRAQKNCRVLGIDLSERMLEFARKRSPYNDGDFVLNDTVVAVQDLADDSFDVAIVSQLLHEVTEDEQRRILQGAFRVAGKTLLLDWRPPLSPLGPGAIPRLLEGTVGRDHRANFLAYVASGGLIATVNKAGLGAHVRETSVHNRGTGQLVMLSQARPNQ